MRGWRAEDSARWAEICADPEVMLYIRDGSTRTAREARAHVARFRMTWTERGFGLWALEPRDRPVCIGFCGMIPVPDGRVEIGWRLARAEWGKGYATEAALPARDWAFEHLPIDRLVAFCRPANLASRRVMDKIGMVQASEGLDPMGLPELVYELTRADWARARR